jgi:hypothetical protein
MHRARLIAAAVLAVLSALCGAVSHSYGNEFEPGTKCQCYFPNSNDYGLYDVEGNCAKLECWVPIKND